MAKIQEILDIEKTRESIDELCSIHLYQEGSFTRAYQMSAWLCIRYIHGFKVNNRRFKSIEEPVAFVGFPTSSMPKWIPDGASIRQIADKHSVLDLTPLLDAEHLSLNSMLEEYSQWKESLPVEENTKKEESRNSNVSNVSLSSVAQCILAYPLEQKSPIDCMLFIAELKKQLSSIF